jgi:hypothetical protein
MTSTNPNSHEGAAIRGLPVARRAYQAVMVALAAFLVVLAIFHEPFQGYLAEVHISGPATAAFDEDETVRWLRAESPNTAVVATPADSSRRAVIRITHLHRQSQQATLRVNEVAARWLYQYLPARLLAYRSSTLADLRAAASAARQREDLARQRLEELRQLQIEHLARASAVNFRTQANTHPFPPVLPRELSHAEQNRGHVQQRLATLRWELSRLLARLTDEHPHVMAIRAQIAELEQQVDVLGHEQVRGTTAERFVSTAHAEAPASEAAEDLPPSPALFHAALQELTTASQQRQQADHRLSERMQELSAEPGAADWSARPAIIVALVGGKPRTVTVAFGALVALCGAMVMIVGSARAANPAVIQTKQELAALLEVPVIGDLSAPKRAAIWHRLIRTTHVRLATHAAELVVATAVVACIVTTAMEPTLAGHAVIDPLGTMVDMLGW